MVAAHLLISEYSTSGAHAGGDFIELYNGTGIDIPVAGWELHIYGADPGQWTTASIAGGWGSSLPDGRRLLFAWDGSALAATADRAFGDPLPPVTGIGIWNGSSYVDAVGNRLRIHNGIYPPAGISEGDGVPPLLQLDGFDQSYERRNGGASGSCVDDNNNATDFKRNIVPGSPSPEGLSASPISCGDVPPPAVPPADHLVISELRTDGALGGQDEFLEIFNPTSREIWLGDYVVLDEGDVLEFEFPNVMLAAGDHFVIGGLTYIGDTDGSYGFGGIQNKGAVKLALGVTGPVIDEIEMGAGPGSPKLPELNGRLDQSYQRIDGGCTDTDSAADFEVTLASSPSTQGTDISRCAVGSDCAAAAGGATELSNADLANCELGGLDLTATALAGANLAGANLQGANLRAVNLTGADLTGAVLASARIADADFDEANLTNANLTFVSANGASFNKAILNGAVLIDAGLARADFDEAQLIGANLENAGLGQAEFVKANLTDATLHNAGLNQTNFDQATLVRADLSSTTLQSANLDSTDLTGATFLAAVGNPAVVDGAIFNNTTCPNSSVTSNPAGCWN